MRRKQSPIEIPKADLLTTINNRTKMYCKIKLMSELKSEIKRGNCKSYLALSPLEKVEMIGNVIHAMQNDENSFMAAKGMITSAKNRGVFDDVTILPETNYTENNLMTLTA